MRTYNHRLSKQAKILDAQPLASGPQTRPMRSEFIPFSSHHLTSPSFQVLARVALPHPRLPLPLDPLPRGTAPADLLGFPSHPHSSAAPVGLFRAGIPPGLHPILN